MERGRKEIDENPLRGMSLSEGKGREYSAE